MHPNPRRRLLRWIGVSAATLGVGAVVWRRFIDPVTAMSYPLGGEAAASRAPTPACDDEPATPTATEGPFYRPSTPRRTRLREATTQGVPLRLEARVVDRRCRPVAGAVVDLWSCDGRGTYDNEGFQLRGHEYTDADGRIVFETVHPAHYGAGGFVRAPHLHLKLQGPSRPMLTTQLFFPGEPTNADDWLFDERLVVDLGRGDGSETARFEFVLDHV